MRLIQFSLICLFTITLSGCLRAYRIGIQQGTVISQKQARSVRVGMSRYQVVKLLGQPLINNVYRDNRLIYVYTFEPSYQPMRKQHLFVSFRGNRVSNVNFSRS